MTVFCGYFFKGRRERQVALTRTTYLLFSVVIMTMEGYANRNAVRVSV
jgi:hypothetical protein